MSFDNKIVMTIYFGSGCSIKIIHNDTDVVKTIRDLKSKVMGGVGDAQIKRLKFEPNFISVQITCNIVLCSFD